MDYEKLAKSLPGVYSLKYILFKSFDSSSLNLGLNKTEERVLMMSRNHTGTTMQFLSREAGLEKGSLTAVIDSLEAKGLVARERDAKDRRSFIVRPTQAGERLAKEVDVLFIAHLTALLDKLTEADRLEFERAAHTFARLIPVIAS
jgi:DNA-binding MarR family transcriptional regulator